MEEHIVSHMASLKQAIEGEMSKVIIGQREILDQILICLLCRGNMLLEGVPGTAKTLMVRILARIIQGSFKRIQFTPDLMPSDITGNNIFDLRSNQFYFSRGPIFTDFLLADEINRAPAKTQAALLEAMEEKKVSIDGTTYPLSPFFTVFATQNPIEFEGTYPLPEAQLDRFFFKVKIDYPDPESESAILVKYHQGFRPEQVENLIRPRLRLEDFELAKDALNRITIEYSLIHYIRDLVRATRNHAEFLFGAGPRASIALLLAAKGKALLSDRTFVTPDDIQSMLYPVLRHRLVLGPEVEMEGVSVEDILTRIIQSIEVPR
ncbi:MAG: MoxR family ATPase [bacterium]